MAQWVKNPTAAAQVTAEARVRSPAQGSGLRIQHCHSCGVGRSCGSHSISLWPNNFYMLWMWLKHGEKSLSFSFLGPHPRHMEVSRLGSYQSYCLRPTSQPQQLQIRAVSATYTTAQGNTRSSAHWLRTGIEPKSSWILVRFINHWGTMGTPRLFFSKLLIHTLKET